MSVECLFSFTPLPGTRFPYLSLTFNASFTSPASNVVLPTTEHCVLSGTPGFTVMAKGDCTVAALSTTMEASYRSAACGQRLTLKHFSGLNLALFAGYLGCIC